MSGVLNVDVTNGTGTVLHFTSRNGSGAYLSPSSTNDTLVQNGDGSWTQSQPGLMKAPVVFADLALYARSDCVAL